MSVILAKHSGFCFGVKRATETAETLAGTGGKIYTLGHLIHNRKYTEYLEKKGVRSIDEDELSRLLSSPPANATVIIRAHGISRSLMQTLRDAEKCDGTLRICDCTCPFVSKIHKIMDENTSGETFAIIFGDKNHPEVRGIVSYVHGDYAVLS